MYSLTPNRYRNQQKIICEYKILRYWLCNILHGVHLHVCKLGTYLQFSYKQMLESCK